MAFVNSVRRPQEEEEEEEEDDDDDEDNDGSLGLAAIILLGGKHIMRIDSVGAGEQDENVGAVIDVNEGGPLVNETSGELESSWFLPNPR